MAQLLQAPAQPGVADGRLACLSEIEEALAALEAALQAPDPGAVEPCAQALQQCLARTLPRLQAGGDQPWPAEALQRLAQARARCRLHLVSLHRANASFDRTLGALFGRDNSTYAVQGASPAARAVGQAYR